MKKISIIASTFHKLQVDQMVEEAKKTATEAGLEVLEVVRVPGSVEKPLAIKRVLEKGEADGVVVLGIIERGETKHGFVMGQSLMHFVMALSLEYMKPITLGVIGPEVLPEQIEPRLLPYAKKAILAQKEMLG